MQLNMHMYCNYTGYSIAAQEYLFAALRHNASTDIKIHFVNQAIGSGISPNRKQLLSSLHKKNTSRPTISLYHTIPNLYRRPQHSKLNIGFCVYETIDPPKEWIHMMNEMDGIMTASEFNKNIFISSGLKKPIHVVPHCFDETMFNNKTTHKGRYNLITFMSIGTWKNRKNWETLIKGWYDAFEKKDGVCLLIKTDKPKSLESTIHKIKRSGGWRSKDTAPIFAEESDQCYFEDIPHILKKADFYISCSMGEGFGLPGLQAMALGIPIVVTKYGGLLEYAKPDFCTYFEPSEYKTQPIMDGIPQFSNKIWPKINISEVRDKLRYALTHQSELKQKADNGYKYVHKTMSYKYIGPKFIKTIQSLSE